MELSEANQGGRQAVRSEMAMSESLQEVNLMFPSSQINILSLQTPSFWFKLLIPKAFNPYLGIKRISGR